MLTCYKCRLSKNEDEFSVGSGKGRRGSKSPYCKSCQTAYNRVWLSRNPTKSRSYYEAKKARPENRLKALLRSTRVDRSELDFEWAWEKLSESGFRCEITGQSFDWKSRSPNALSIDRIDCTKGYTKDNVRFVAWWLNAAMGSWGLEKLKELIAAWEI